MKMAICKGFMISGRQKYPKNRVVNCHFAKIEARLKALYVRLKGIPEGGLKALKTKGYLSLRGTKRRGNPAVITISLLVIPMKMGMTYGETGMTDKMGTMHNSV